MLNGMAKSFVKGGVHIVWSFYDNV
jgi:hypothetical protein